MSAQTGHERRIHILGASGSGTTTLGRALAEELHCTHLDSDDFFWLPTVPPYQTFRPREQRQQLLAESLKTAASWVLSGSLCGWGDPFIPQFHLVVFLWVPHELRMQRLRERELARYGAEAIEPAGARHEAYRAFMAWAAAYDEGDLTMRSRRMHEAWLRELPCPVLRLEGDMTPPQQVAAVQTALQGRLN